MDNGKTALILPMSSAHVVEVAKLHMAEISEGVISVLGHKFACSLYQAMIESERYFGFVAVKNSQVLGFAACAEDTSAVYKSVLKGNFFKLLWACFPKILSIRNLKYAIETLFYPVRCGGDLPVAELLSVVVDRQARGKGIGQRLVEASCAEFRSRGIGAFKTIVFERFPSNAFYQHVGFKLSGKRCQHGKQDVHNVYIMEVLSQG